MIRDAGIGSIRAAFGRYCRAVAARYVPLGVKHFEVWNEPNLCIPSFCPWSPAPNPSEYVEVLKVAYGECNAVDSNVTVVGGSTSPLDEPETPQKIPGAVFINRVFQLGGGNYMDAVSFHQYPITRSPEQWVSYECGRISLSEDRSPKPAFLALKTVARTIGLKPFVSMTNFNSEYAMRFGNPPDQTLVLWHGTAQSTKTINAGSKYFTVIDRDGARRHFIAPDSTAVITLLQGPQYVVPMAQPPKIKTLQLKPRRLFIDSTQSLQMNISGVDTGGIVVNIAPGAVQWEYVGSGGSVDSNGVFRARSRGSGFIVATYQELADTARRFLRQIAELN